ncbi:hypothetical protein NBT05_03005 [Aquimarina sp. ERC-38]|uniref:hypothetical protein n=1 Tax=Aquimarina sp. ERC-38 TaxID=2949996 RepID=UPI002246E0D6|nr:hypothetical protein [Aquimarina sp. ERC-38]UZO81450.1 hypothetical protein NBT05_03005 [Aquimarina sp. ERC-38]
MIQKTLVLLFILCSGFLMAQEGTSSPYSFYGIGLQKFKGTTENRSMGGLSIQQDSIHINLQNPAAYGALKLTTFTVAANYNGLRLSNANDDTSYKDNATLEYFAIGIPIGKFGVGLGVTPLSAVGYNVRSEFQNNIQERFSGSGGVNKVYLSTGVSLTKNFSVGLEVNYNFGNIENRFILFQQGSLFQTRELNETDLSGVGLTFGVNYQTKISDKLTLVTSITSTPPSKLDTDTTSELAQVNVQAEGRETVIRRQDIDAVDNEVDLPAEVKVGFGIGEDKKWLIGAEYNYRDSEDQATINFAPDEVFYKSGFRTKLGGYYIPNYRSLTSYFNRVIYRAGIRFERSGLVVNNKDIDEFGMSFGIGLPVSNAFSSLNLGLEVGQRGTTSAGLVKENFFNFSLSLSLNDKWFRQIKFN